MERLKAHILFRFCLFIDDMKDPVSLTLTSSVSFASTLFHEISLVVYTFTAIQIIKFVGHGFVCDVSTNEIKVTCKY